MAVPPSKAKESEPFMAYDVSKWPHVRAKCKDIYPNDAMFEAHLSCFSELLYRGEVFTVSFNLENAKMPAMDMLKKLAEFMKAHKEPIQANLAASTVVTNSMFVHGALKVLFTLKQPVKPQKSFGSDAEAHLWLKAHYNAAARKGKSGA